MNNVFAQTHTSSMRADRDAELGGHQQHGEDLAYACKADGVDLADVDGLGLEKLLEDHPVMCVLTSRDADTIRLESISDGGVTENIVWSSGFLYEPGGEVRKIMQWFDWSPYQGLISARPLVYSIAWFTSHT